MKLIPLTALAGGLVAIGLAGGWWLTANMHETPEEAYMNRCLETAQTDRTLQEFAQGWGDTETVCSLAYEGYLGDYCDNRKTDFDICFAGLRTYWDPDLEHLRDEEPAE